MLFCTDCPTNSCDSMDMDASPGKCPGRDPELEKLLNEYRTEEILEFGRVCSEVSMSKDGHKPRILEIIEVAKRMNYRKLGLAFCIGFIEEAKVVKRILEHHGFDVAPIICKVGGVDKGLQGIPEGGNAMCNPIVQAHLLNEEHTDFNIIMGLCVGHDSIFFKYSEAPVTVLAVKDKVLGHNPLACIYTADGYYKNKLFP